jgi:hypothetical protein
VDVHYLFGENQLLKNMQLLKKLYPERSVLSKIYKSLRDLLTHTGELEVNLIQWAEQIQSATGLILLPDTIVNSLTVFQDLGLIRHERSGAAVHIHWLGEPAEKLNLEDSPFYSAYQNIKKGYQAQFMNFQV